MHTVLQQVFEFKKPIRPASRGCLHVHGLEEGKDVFTQRQNSAPARMVCAFVLLGVPDGKIKASAIWS